MGGAVGTHTARHPNPSPALYYIARRLMTYQYKISGLKTKNMLENRK
ncbi:MAG: hypothetical protein QE493_03975 [Verrucomicrobiae bacterium]|nr:hypothetical protein [Verrucomicrobiae bacterium]